MIDSTMNGGPALDLFVHVGEVRADDRQTQQLDAADEQDHDDHGREALRRRAGVGEAQDHLGHERERRDAATIAIASTVIMSSGT